MAKVTTKELAELERRPRVTIAWRCRSGYYTLAQRVKFKGAGGRKGFSWLIDMDDPRISQGTRDKYDLKNYIIHLAKKCTDKRFNDIECILSVFENKSTQFETFMRKLRGNNCVD
jgi:hypothetical protein